MRLGSEIPSISTVHAQAQRCCAQVIHIFVHSQQASSPLAARQAAADQRAGATGDTVRGRGCKAIGLARMRSCKNPAADARRHLGLAVGDGGFGACWPWSRRGRVGTSPVLAAVTRVIAAGILTIAGVPVLEEDVPAGQNQTRPPMYEMGGLARHRHARSGQLPGFAGATRRPPVPSIRARDPVSRLLPRSWGRPQGGARFQR